MFLTLGLNFICKLYYCGIKVGFSNMQWTFSGINREQALARPILYSNWLSKDYVPVLRDQLREYVKARLKVK